MTSRLVHGDAVAVLAAEPAESIHLALFNPPYDQATAYPDMDFQYRQLGDQLRRLLVPGGVVVLVIADRALTGHQSGTSFRVAVDWMDRVGFNLFQSLVYVRADVPEQAWASRFRQVHENILVFVNGERPRVFDKSRVLDNGHCPTTVQRHVFPPDQPDGHPGRWPTSLPATFIKTFTRPGDTVLDPYVGTGASLLAAQRLGRVTLGVDICAACVAAANEALDHLV